MALAVPEAGEKAEKSLALMIRAQFTEYDVYNVIGHTEIPTKHVPSLVRLLTLQRVEEILATEKPDPLSYGLDEDGMGGTAEGKEAYEAELEKYKLKELMLKDPNAMVATILYGHNFYYGLCMRSRDRKIRLEGLKLGQGVITREVEEGIGIGQKLLNMLSLGRLGKYDKVYVKKER